MVVVVAVVGVLVFVGLAWLWMRHTSRVQARMQGSAGDLRRADDGGDPPNHDVTTQMGP